MDPRYEMLVHMTNGRSIRLGEHTFEVAPNLDVAHTYNGRVLAHHDLYGGAMKAGDLLGQRLAWGVQPAYTVEATAP